MNHYIHNSTFSDHLSQSVQSTMWKIFPLLASLALASFAGASIHDLQLGSGLHPSLLNRWFPSTATNNNFGWEGRYGSWAKKEYCDDNIICEEKINNKL